MKNKSRNIYHILDFKLQFIIHIVTVICVFFKNHMNKISKGFYGIFMF